MKNRRTIENLLIVFVFAVIALGMNACSEPSHESTDTGITLGTDGNTSRIFEVTLDGCEYYYHKSSDEFGLAHKGNCSNPIHCHNGGGEGGNKDGEILLNTTNRVDD